MSSTTSTTGTTYTIKELVRALENSGVVLKAPTSLGAYDSNPFPLDTQLTFPTAGSATSAVQGVRQALATEDWRVLHSGTSDYLVAGPTSSLTPEAVTKALVDLQAERLAGSEVHSSQRWFCITVGLETGVFQGVHVVNLLIHRVSGSAAAGYATKEDAEATYEAAGAVRCVVPKTSETRV
ncbi:hypothetical protein H1R20_g12900, partial [Candolleomyces eurysporus]